MLQFLINVLTPVFENMGVSPTDVEQYVNSLGGYIYAILALFVVMVAVMVGAHWFAKKGTRHVVRWSAAVAWITDRSSTCKRDLLWPDVQQYCTDP